MNVKLLSLNLWHGTLIEKALDFLEQENADIVMLQEVHGGTNPALPPALRSYELIKNRLKYTADDFAPTVLFNDDAGKVPNGQAIFSKFPIIASSLTFLIIHSTTTTLIFRKITPSFPTLFNTPF